MDAPRVGYAYVWWVNPLLTRVIRRTAAWKRQMRLGYTQYGHFFASDSKFHNPIGYGR